MQLAQTLFVALDSSRSQLEYKKEEKKASKMPRLKERTIPLFWHFGFVAICFTMSTLSNLSHNYGVTVPFHVVVKSSGLVVNMLVGAVLLGKRYDIKQVFSVLFILAGVLIVTLSKADDKKAATSDTAQESSTAGDMSIGVVMLVVSLFLSSLLGVLQE